jgi:DNA (cytosine-5)-methyltransferase 1
MEHFVDLFAGAGGSGSGVLEAYARLGRLPRGTFVNHWDRAIEIHELNHPGHTHYTEDLFLLDPEVVFPTASNVSLLWASPSCTSFSLARGGRPVTTQSRSHADTVLEWLRHLRPEILLVENVSGFKTWGPLESGQPDPKHKGEFFDKWLRDIEAEGYETDHRILCSADYGDPTIRKRLFIQCIRRDTGKRIVWPDATHSRGGLDGKKPWVTARDIIDWSDTGESIFTRKRPLSAKTLKRIAVGLVKYGLKDFFVPHHRGSKNDHVRPVDVPVSAVTSTMTGEGLARPCCIKLKGTCTAVDIEDPLHTVTAGGNHHAVMQAFMMALDQAGKNGANDNTYAVTEPVRTITTKANQCVANVEMTPFLVQTAHGDVGNAGQRVRDLLEPLMTVCGHRGDAALIRPWIYTYYSSGSTGAPDDEPLPTVRTKEGTALCYPVLEIDGQTWLLDIKFRMLRVLELARAQGFPDDYKWTGTLTEQVRAIGNSVSRRLARALGLAVLTQNEDISKLHVD